MISVEVNCPRCKQKNEIKVCPNCGSEKLQVVFKEVDEKKSIETINCTNCTHSFGKIKCSTGDNTDIHLANGSVTIIESTDIATDDLLIIFYISVALIAFAFFRSF